MRRSCTRNKPVVRFWKVWLQPIIVALLLATSFKSAIADWNDVPTGSMLPTILIGDRIFVNKLAYDLKLPYTTRHLARWAEPRRGDIVVFYSPVDGQRLVKRIVGVPGDRIEMNANRLIINGSVLSYESLGAKAAETEHDDPWPPGARFFNEDLEGITHRVMWMPPLPAMRNFGPVTVPNSQYFMMGDNRDNSADSRFFGFVERHRIVGRATAVVFSRHPSILCPRWHRFFQKLR